MKAGGFTGAVKTARFRENIRYGRHETVELKGVKGEFPLCETKVLRRIMGWQEADRDTFYGKASGAGA